jgi:hypothetical protein
MRILTIIDTVAIALISLLLVAILRSHAEMIRRSNTNASGHTARENHEPDASRLAPGVPHLRANLTPAYDVAGSTLGGGSLLISASGGQSTLLAFLSSGCTTCQAFWRGLPGAARELLPLGARIVIVTKDREYESPHKLRQLYTSNSIPLVMSSNAWQEYHVESSPSTATRAECCPKDLQPHGATSSPYYGIPSKISR